MNRRNGWESGKGSGAQPTRAAHQPHQETPVASSIPGDIYRCKIPPHSQYPLSSVFTPSSQFQRDPPPATYLIYSGCLRCMETTMQPKPTKKVTLTMKSITPQKPLRIREPRRHKPIYSGLKLSIHEMLTAAAASCLQPRLTILHQR